MSTQIKSGVWSTDTGSEFNLKIDGDKVTGTFRSVHGQPKPEDMFELTGFVNGPLIGMCVSWKEHKSITCWTGILDIQDGKECIQAVWHLGREFADYNHTQKNEYWEAFKTFSGCYFYQRE